MRSDAGTGDSRVRLPPGDRIDELGDFLEWLANANPEDEKKIRAEIKRYYYDVGDTIGGNALNAALSDVLEPDFDREAREDILNGIAPYANADPAEVAQFRNLTVGGILASPGMLPAAATIGVPSEVWKLGWAARGAYISEQLGANLPNNFPVIDIWQNGIATSIKSIDLDAATYQSAARLTYRLNSYIDRLAQYEGDETSAIIIRPSDIRGRTLNVAIPKNSMSAQQKTVFDAARVRARSFDVDLIITPF